MGLLQSGVKPSTCSCGGRGLWNLNQYLHSGMYGTRRRKRYSISIKVESFRIHFTFGRLCKFSKQAALWRWFETTNFGANPNRMGHRQHLNLQWIMDPWTWWMAIFRPTDSWNFTLAKNRIDSEDSPNQCIYHIWSCWVISIPDNGWKTPNMPSFHHQVATIWPTWPKIKSFLKTCQTSA